MSVQDDEREHQLKIWQAIREAGADNASPSTLHKLGAYGGAQGIWVDKKRTGPVAPDGFGVTVGLLHTGRHYPDDISDDGLIYHYPKTGRGPSRDAAEVAATKNAASLKLPVFVVLPERRPNQEKFGSDGSKIGMMRRSCSSSCLAKFARLTNRLSIRTSRSR